MSDLDVHEECPHCDAAPPSRQLDMHVARQHADLPPCAARIEPEGGGLYACGFRAGHNGGEYGTWHASKRDAAMGRYIWNDTATGATPHQPPVPSDSLDKLKAAGVVSHTVIAGASQATCGEHDGPCFPDPDARCPAHGDPRCALCHRNPSTCADPEYVECGTWSRTGMHWDTCPNRVRGPAAPTFFHPNRNSVPTSKISCRPEGEVQLEPPESKAASLSAYSGLVVQPYRNDQGKSCWVFRCWGTDTCDGWLSLDHTGEQSAVRALTRHFEECHTPGALKPEVKIRIRDGLTEQQRAEVKRILADELRRIGRGGRGVR
jgi:hypothetical protein